MTQLSGSPRDKRAVSTENQANAHLHCPICSNEKGLREPTAADYLACERLSWTLCPPGLCDAESGPDADERRFWMRFEPLALEWLREGVASGAIERPTESWFGVSTLLTALYEYGDDEDEWVKVTGYQILFETLGHGGLMQGFRASLVLFGVEAFLEFLRAGENLREDAAIHLLTEVNAWQERILKFLSGEGPWCRPDRESMAVSRIGY